MATKYEYIFDEFKDKITDPDLLLLSKTLEVHTLRAIMAKSITKCKRICKASGLDTGDDEIFEFAVDLPDEVIDIVTEWMTVFWLEPYLNNIENLRNALSTKDFTVFSPANLLEKISNRYELARKHARSAMNEYSYVIADMTRLKS